MENFATINVTSSYAGDALQGYILKALIGGETLSTNGISVLTNVKYKRTLKKLASSGIVQDYSCDFTATSGVTITEASVEPKAFKVNESICFEDIWNLWDSDTMAAGMNNENLPQELISGLVDEYVGQVAKEVEEAIWQGNATGSTSTIKDLWDGYEYILTNGAAVDVAAVAVSAITVTTVVTELNRVYNALPNAMKKVPKAEMVMFVSYEILSLYEQNLATQGVRTSIEGGVPTLYGIELKAAGGLSAANKMAFGQRKNFYVATDLLADINEIKLLDQRQITGAEKVNFVLKAKMDVAIAEVTEVVWYA